MDSRLRIDYPIPELKGVKIDVDLKGRGIPTFDDELRAVRVGDTILEGDETDVLNGLSSLIKELDPDMISILSKRGCFLHTLSHKAGRGQWGQARARSGPRGTDGKRKELFHIWPNKVQAPRL